MALTYLSTVRRLKHMMNETWKSIPGADGKYEASSLGSVRSLARDRVRILRQATTAKGYRVVPVKLNGRYKAAASVHSLVLMAFVGPRPDGMFGCHNNSIKDDNRIENLRWDTPKANTADRIERFSYAGERNHRAKLSDEQVRAIFADMRKVPAIANDFGVGIHTVYGIKSGRNWTSVTGL